MESNGVIQLYERSIHKDNIPYNAFIGDGDSSSYSAVNKSRPYGQITTLRKANM